MDAECLVHIADCATRVRVEPVSAYVVRRTVRSAGSECFKAAEATSKAECSGTVPHTGDTVRHSDWSTTAVLTRIDIWRVVIKAQRQRRAEGVHWHDHHNADDLPLQQWTCIVLQVLVHQMAGQGYCNHREHGCNGVSLQTCSEWGTDADAMFTCSLTQSGRPDSEVQAQMQYIGAAECMSANGATTGSNYNPQPGRHRTSTLSMKWSNAACSSTDNESSLPASKAPCSVSPRAP